MRRASVGLLVFGILVNACTEPDNLSNEPMQPYMQVGGAWEQDFNISPVASAGTSPTPAQ